jgi:hypothetical protein
LIKSGSSDFHPVETASILLDYDDANVQQQHYTNDHSTDKSRKTKVVMQCTRRCDQRSIQQKFCSQINVIQLPPLVLWTIASYQYHMVAS